jgi:hypothetical protein
MIKTKNRKINKKGFELDMLGWFIIAVAVLIIVVFVSIVWKDKMSSAIKYIMDVFKFKR